MSSNNTELIISGFYKDDLKKVNRELKKYNFDFMGYKEKNNWVSSKYCYNLNCLLNYNSFHSNYILVFH